MKKIIGLTVLGLLSLVLVACGTSGGSSSDEQSSEITVGATSVPHAEVLEEAKPLLEEEGITLNIETYQEYVLPNKDLENGTLDANYFQHIPYLEDQKKEFGYDFVNLGGIHIEPMGIYSKNVTNLDDIEKGTEVLMSRSVADHGRILSLLQEHDLIKISEDVDPVAATVDDVVENPHELKFSADYDAGFLPQLYESEKDALVAINTNYAIEADLVPSEDAIILEGSESPYVNVIATRSEDEDNENLQTLVEVLRSEEIQTFIEEKYEGAVVPVSE